MEFPITKFRLRTISDELYLIHIDKFIFENVEYLTNQIFKAASTQTTNKKISIPIDSISLNYKPPDFMMTIMRNKLPNGRIPIMEHITEILDKLKKRFPDSIICLDPMKTYFFIDWT